MTNFTVKQIKDAMIELYQRNDELSNRAYRLAFDILEEKIGGDELDKFLDENGL